MWLRKSFSDSQSRRVAWRPGEQPENASWNGTQELLGDKSTRSRVFLWWEASKSAFSTVGCGRSVATGMLSFDRVCDPVSELGYLAGTKLETLASLLRSLVIFWSTSSTVDWQLSQWSLLPKCQLFFFKMNEKLRRFTGLIPIESSLSPWISGPVMARVDSWSKEESVGRRLGCG